MLELNFDELLSRKRKYVALVCFTPLICMCVGGHNSKKYFLRTIELDVVPAMYIYV